MSIDLSYLAMAGAAVIMGLGCAFQAALGFGFALLSVPLLIFIDPKFVPGPILLAAIPLCIWSAWRERKAIDASILKWLLAGVIAGTVIGALALKFLTVTTGTNALLTRMFGALILLAVLLSVAAPSFQANPTTVAIAGGVGGVMGAMVGVHGPPAALVLQNVPPAAVRAMLGVYFGIAYALAVMMFWWLGLFGRGDLERTLIVLPGTIFGIAAAPYLRRFIDQEKLRIAILAVSTMSAIILILR